MQLMDPTTLPICSPPRPRPFTRPISPWTLSLPCLPNCTNSWHHNHRTLIPPPPPPPIWPPCKPNCTCSHHRRPATPSSPHKKLKPSPSPEAYYLIEGVITIPPPPPSNSRKNQTSVVVLGNHDPRTQSTPLPDQVLETVLKAMETDKLGVLVPTEFTESDEEMQDLVPALTAYSEEFEKMMTKTWETTQMNDGVITDYSIRPPSPSLPKPSSAPPPSPRPPLLKMMAKAKGPRTRDNEYAAIVAIDQPATADKKERSSGGVEHQRIPAARQILKAVAASLENRIFVDKHGKNDDLQSMRTMVMDYSNAYNSVSDSMKELESNLEKEDGGNRTPQVPPPPVAPPPTTPRPAPVKPPLPPRHRRLMQKKGGGYYLIQGLLNLSSSPTTTSRHHSAVVVYCDNGQLEGKRTPSWPLPDGVMDAVLSTINTEKVAVFFPSQHPERNPLDIVVGLANYNLDLDVLMGKTWDITQDAYELLPDFRPRFTELNFVGAPVPSLVSQMMLQPTETSQAFKTTNQHAAVVTVFNHATADMGGAGGSRGEGIPAGEIMKAFAESLENLDRVDYEWEEEWREGEIDMEVRNYVRSYKKMSRMTEVRERMARIQNDRVTAKWCMMYAQGIFEIMYGM